MSYVVGIDLGSSSVKVVLVDKNGCVKSEVTEHYQSLQEKSGWSEQEPELWVERTLSALSRLLLKEAVPATEVEGISFSGQMHGLVLLDRQQQVIRNAILWNDTRTTKQCQQIEQTLGKRLLEVSKNRALEGFTLPKLLWVKENEPHNFSAVKTFLLPKDYLRYRLTGQIATDYSDAAGTLLLDIENKRWSDEVLRAFEIPADICPPLAESDEMVGTLLTSVASKLDWPNGVKVFAGGADNACGALGSGVLSSGTTMCSIGTSGVVLNYEESSQISYDGQLHVFNHAQRDAYYSMGVTLSAGYSLDWFKKTFAQMATFEQLLVGAGQIPPGANGLLFAPYLVGERTPHADAVIRASFIGVDSGHHRDHFTRAVLEGIIFSLRESIEIMRKAGKNIDRVISIGGGAKSDLWLQIQADIFGVEVGQLTSEQGPALGAAMLAAVGCGWFATVDDCAQAFIRRGKAFQPNGAKVSQYDELYDAYCDIYPSTRVLNQKLHKFRNSASSAT